MVERHLTLPHKFICLTENSKGLTRGIAAYNFIDMRLEKWWNKLELFKPHPALENNRTLFFDLDTVIVGSLDEMASYNGDIAILEDLFARRARLKARKERPTSQNGPRGAWLGSAVMSISPGFGKYIWETLQKNISVIQRYAGDQQFIGAELTKRGIQPGFWQELFPGHFISYKAGNLDKSYNAVKAKDDLRVVCFHGKPRPHEVFHLQWMKENWR